MRRKINKIAVALFAAIMGIFFLTGCAPQASDSENSASTESNISVSTESGSAAYSDENSSDSTESGSSSEDPEISEKVEMSEAEFERRLKEYYVKPNYGKTEKFDESENVLTFMVDGEVYHTTKVEANKPVEIPLPPEKEGYLFSSWWYEVYFDEPVLRALTFSDNYGPNKISRDLAVYAKFFPRIESNDGEGLTFTLNESGMAYSVTDFNDEYTVVNIPETYNNLPVTEIAEGAFRNSKNLVTVSIPSSVERIERYAFSRCHFLSKVSFSEGLKEVKDGAFNYCSSLVGVYFPDSLRRFGSLGKQLGNPIPILGELPCFCVFESCHLVSVSFPKGITPVVWVEFWEWAFRDLYFRGTKEECESLVYEEVYAKPTHLSIICHYTDGEL